ncbi:uncharacterized protein LOC135947730 [Cloeon dipterum]
MNLLALCVFALFHLVSLGDACTNNKLPAQADLIKRDGKTYYLSRIEDERDMQLDWSSAQAWCKEHGMELSSLETKDEMRYLREQMGAYYWTSGYHTQGDTLRSAAFRDLITDTFTWAGTGKKVELEIRKSYYAGECVGASKDGLYAWPCSNLRYFVCELEKC